MAKQHLLIVDSDPKSLRVLEVSLKKAGFSITKAENGLDAIEKIKISTPDMVITETAMPQMDGYGLIKSLKENDEWKDIPVMFLTAQKSIEDKVRGLEQGVEDYLTKPIFIKEILARVSLVMQRRQRERLETRSSRTEFSGKLSDMGIIDLIQTIDISQKSGIIEIHNQSEEGRIYFSQGKVVDAETKQRRGEEAVYRMLVWIEGTFHIEFKNVDCEDNITLSTQGLLMEGMRRLDEFGRLQEQLPPLESIFDIDEQLLSERLGEIPDEINGLLKHFDGNRTLMEVVDMCEIGDIEALTIITKLYFEGLICDMGMLGGSSAIEESEELSGDNSDSVLLDGTESAPPAAQAPSSSADEEDHEADSWAPEAPLSAVEEEESATRTPSQPPKDSIQVENKNLTNTDEPAPRKSLAGSFVSALTQAPSSPLKSPNTKDTGTYDMRGVSLTGRDSHSSGEGDSALVAGYKSKTKTDHPPLAARPDPVTPAKDNTEAAREESAHSNTLPFEDAAIIASTDSTATPSKRDTPEKAPDEDSEVDAEEETRDTIIAPEDSIPAPAAAAVTDLNTDTVNDDTTIHDKPNKDQATVDEANDDQATVDEANDDQATVDEANDDQATVDEANDDQVDSTNGLPTNDAEEPARPSSGPRSSGTDVRDYVDDAWNDIPKHQPRPVGKYVGIAAALLAIVGGAIFFMSRSDGQTINDNKKKKERIAIAQPLTTGKEKAVRIPTHKKSPISPISDVAKSTEALDNNDVDAKDAIPTKEPTENTESGTAAPGGSDAGNDNLAPEDAAQAHSMDKYNELLKLAAQAPHRKKLQLYLDAIDANPEGIEALTAFVMHTMEAAKYHDQSLEYAHRILKLQPSHAKAWLAIGYIHQQRGNDTAAQNAYQKCANGAGPATIKRDCKLLVR